VNDDRFAILRQQIPALRSVIYLNTGWSGPSPERVLDQIVRYLRWEAAEGPTSPPVMAAARQLPGRAREAVAATFGGSPDEIVLTANTTEGINHVLNGLAWQAGDEVLTYNFEHHSVLVPLYHLRERRGVPVRFVQLDPAMTPDEIVASFAAALTPRTRLLVVSHISFSAGLRLPLERIAALAHAQGTEVLADGAQTAGQIALDFPQSGADYYAFTGHKWLLGPDGVGALFVRRERLVPLVPTAVSVHAAIWYDTNGGYQPRTDSPEKFQLTTQSNALLTGFIEALTLHQELGPAAVEERSRALAFFLRRQLTCIPGVTLFSPAHPETACGLVCFRVSGRSPREVVEQLWQRRRIVVRSVDETACVRATCHPFVTEQDLTLLAEEVEALAR
jgi:L-cysteine/cystine lyase